MPVNFTRWPIWLASICRIERGFSWEGMTNTTSLSVSQAAIWQCIEREIEKLKQSCKLCNQMMKRKRSSHDIHTHMYDYINCYSICFCILNLFTIGAEAPEDSAGPQPLLLPALPLLLCEHHERKKRGRECERVRKYFDRGGNR